MSQSQCGRPPSGRLCIVALVGTLPLLKLTNAGPSGSDALPFKHISCDIYCYAVVAIVSNSYPPLPRQVTYALLTVRNSKLGASTSFGVLPLY